MGFFPNEGDVDANGAEEVNLRTAAGAELLGQQTSAASLPVVIASDQTSIPVQQFGPNSAWVRITGNGTTTIKSGAGFLRRIVKNAGGNVTIYNSTTGSGAVIHALTGTNPQGTITYDVPFTIGLTVVTASGPDILVVYD